MAARLFGRGLFMDSTAEKNIHAFRAHRCGALLSQCRQSHRPASVPTRTPWAKSVSTMAWMSKGANLGWNGWLFVGKAAFVRQMLRRISEGRNPGRMPLWPGVLSGVPDATVWRGVFVPCRVGCAPISILDAVARLRVRHLGFRAGLSGVLSGFNCDANRCHYGS